MSPQSKANLYLVTLTIPQLDTPADTTASLMRAWSTFHRNCRWWRGKLIGGVYALDYGESLNNPHLHIIVEADELDEQLTIELGDEQHTESTISGHWYCASVGGGVHVAKIGNTPDDRRRVCNYVCRKGGASIDPAMLDDYAIASKGVRYRSKRLGTWRSKPQWAETPQEDGLGDAQPGHVRRLWRPASTINPARRRGQRTRSRTSE